MVSSLAVKYARALLGVVAESGREAQTLEQLSAFRQLLESHRELRETLENPALPFFAKRRIVEQIAAGLPLSTTVRNFVLVVLENGRIGQFGRFLEAYRELWDERQGILRGRVTSARDLDLELRRKLESSIRELARRDVKLDYRRDASLIGGVKLQIGSTIFDSSIRTQLQEIERRLTGQ